MSEKSTEKTILKRIFKTKEQNEPTTARDIEKVVIAQNESAKQIKKLADNIQQNQHKAAVGTNDLVSHIKHFKHTEKKRQKLTNQYIKQQREDPTLSPLKIVQMVHQDTDSLPPYTETPSAPSVKLYPELQAHHTEMQTIDPFAPLTLGQTLRTLDISDFSLEDSLSRNQIVLQNEITTKEQLLKYYRSLTTPVPDKIGQLIDTIQLIKQLKYRLPSLYEDDTTLKKEYRHLMKTTPSSASQSPHTSRASTPRTPDQSRFTQESSTHNSPESQKSKNEPPFMTYAHTPLNEIINDLNELGIDTHKPHTQWEFHINRLQDELIFQYLQQHTIISTTRTETLYQFTKLHNLLHKIQIFFHEDTLEQNLNTKSPQESYRYLHLFLSQEQSSIEKQLTDIQEHIKKVNFILQKLQPTADQTFIKHYQIKLFHLDNLRIALQRTNQTQSAGFSSPKHPDNSLSNNPSKQKQQRFQAPTASPSYIHNPPSIFHPEVNQTRFIPKMLLNPLELGDEIQWARLTQATLEEFPHIDSKLKLQALIQHLARHPAAKQAASAQLLQAIQDPCHDPLNGFFTWLFQSYSLSRQEQNTNLRKAIEQQKFDWSNNPAIDLQTAIAHVHMSLNEINKNEIFRETLQDALKYKLQPYYHLIADTPIPDLPEKLRFIWKKIAVPTTNKKDVNPPSEPIILNTVTKPSLANETVAKSQNTSPTHPELRHSLAQEIKSIHKEIGRIHQLQTTQEQQRPQKRPETRACFRCGKIGHVAKFCRTKTPQFSTNKFQPQSNPQRPPFKPRFNQQQRPFQSRQSNNYPNQNRTFRPDDTRSRPNNNNYNRQQNNSRGYNQQRFNRTSNNRFNSNPRKAYNNNQSNSQNPTHPREHDSYTDKKQYQKNNHYSKPAQYAEDNFEPNLSAPQRWNSEVKRPPYPYEKAMADREFAMHFDITPDSPTASPKDRHFLEMTQSPKSPPT